MDRTKTQGDEIPNASGLAEDVIVSPDARRERRIPPGQARTKKWPVLDASGPPAIDLERWRFRVGGLVGTEAEWNWEEFLRLPRREGVRRLSLRDPLVAPGECVGRCTTRGVGAAGGRGAARRRTIVMAYGYDRGWTTNLPLADFLAEDALVAFSHDGEPLTLEHGGPARLIVPRLYSWKSAKWVAGVELMEQDRPGFWEANGYHMRGDPWKEERFG